MYWWKYFMRLVWGPRVERIDDYARKAAECLAALGRCDPVFDTWSAYLPGEEPFPLNKEAIKKWMLEVVAEQIESDDGYDSEFGYSITLNAGLNKEDWVQFQLQCSGRSDLFPNCCQLSLPGSGAAANRIIRWNALSEVVAALVRIWRPDWGHVMTDAQSELERFGANGAQIPFVSWLFYLCAERGPLPRLPEYFRVIPVE
ncbi:MAG TPA: hypothetical protein EYP04_10045, partial [Anaerolineae bacterium]|nr:hypothetical protein [Anaerolineae bacterium]